VHAPGTQRCTTAVDRTTAWLQNYRRVLVRHERPLITYRAFVVLACVIITLGALLE
jgi:transposase